MKYEYRVMFRHYDGTEVALNEQPYDSAEAAQRAFDRFNRAAEDREVWIERRPVAEWERVS